MFRWPLLIVAAMLGLLVACQPPTHPAPAQQVGTLVRVITLQKSTTHPTRKLSGTVRATLKTNLSFSIPGTLENIFVKTGELVSKHQPIAQLDPKPFQLRVAAAKAAYAKAQASLNEKKLTHNAYLKLYRSKYVSNIDYQKVRAAMQVANNEALAAKAKLQLATRDLQRTTIYAPYNGVIAKRLFDPFVEIAAGQTVVKFHNTKQYEISVQVPDTFIHHLKLDQSATILLPTLNNLKLKGRISEVSATAELANSFNVRVLLLNGVPRLFDGMTAEVLFKLEKRSKPGFALPLSALVAKNGAKQKVVFIYNPSTQQVRAYPVNIISIKDHSVIVTGLSENMQVVTSGAAYLEDDEKVSLLEEKKP